MNLKNFNVWDIGLIKWSSIIFTLFLVSVWPFFGRWVSQTHWGWFLAISLLLAVKPLKKTFVKPKNKK